jgi:hypothetical protein
MLSYCARLCALAPDEANNVAVAASQTKAAKLFIKTISADGRMNDRLLRLVPSAGQDVAENGPDRGEGMQWSALTNALGVTLKIDGKIGLRDSASCGRAGMSCKSRSQGVKRISATQCVHFDSKSVPFKKIASSETPQRRPKGDA